MYPRDVREWAERWWSDDDLGKRFCAFCVKLPLEASIAFVFYLVARSLVIAVSNFSVTPDVLIVSPGTTEVIGYGLLLNLVFCNFIRKRPSGGDDSE